MFFKAKIPTTTEVRVADRLVSVSVRTHARARSFRLSLPHSGTPVLTLPPGGRWSEAEAFLRRQSGWLAERLEAARAPVSFGDGVLVPLRGVPHRIIATGKLRGRVEAGEDDGEKILFVPGEAAHQARRLVDWLKGEAARELKLRSGFHAERLGVVVKSITMRDQASRWGSCSSRGSLNYNWRLILAPPFVLDYVAAHEVAHLVEMNHSAAFWGTVKRTLPEMERGRAWLKTHGRELMAYRAD